MHSFMHSNNKNLGSASARQTEGWVMNWGWRYDLFVGFFDTILLGGKLKELRRRTLAVAQLRGGETVLDVGCGTGTLALLAKERVGETGYVSGIDPSPAQIGRASAKAARRHCPIDFQLGVIEQLAFPDQSFDVVLSTLMMHHLPDALKQQGLLEIRRVLKPEGRLVVADFKRPERRPGQSSSFGAGQTGLQDLPTLMKKAGFVQIESGELRFPRLPGLSGAGFVLGRRS